MTSINATRARANLLKVMALVNETSVPVTLTNNEGKNAVLIGEDDWHAIQETLYIKLNSGNDGRFNKRTRNSVDRMHFGNRCRMVKTNVPNCL